MNTLFLAPHSDDECLFGSFTLLKFSPHVVIVYLPREQQEHETRLGESRGAMEDFCFDPYDDLEWFGCYEGEPCVSLEQRLRALIPPESIFDYDPDQTYYDHVFAPAVEEGGHDEHNYVGQVALDVFGRDRVTSYATYRRGQGRTVTENEVVPLEPAWWAWKLKALTNYTSQIERESTRYWFVDSRLREYYQ